MLFLYFIRKTVTVNCRKWTVVHESQKSLSSSNHNIGLTIPMKWIPGCMGNISGAPAGLNAMYNQWKTIIFLIYSFTVVF